MSGADLFTDGFPHGTPRGFDLGCRGGACPAKVETGQSCREASIRLARDYGYRKLVQSGASVDVLALPEGGLAPTPAKKPRQGYAAVYAPLGQHKPSETVPPPAPVKHVVVADVAEPEAAEPAPVIPEPVAPADETPVAAPVPMASEPDAAAPAASAPRRAARKVVAADPLDLLDEAIKAMAEVLVVMKNTADEIRKQRRALLRREAARNGKEQS